MLDDVELNKLLNDTTAAEGMAGDEFGQAWKPTLTADANTTQAVVSESAAAGGVVATAATQAALEQRREMEKKLAEAKSQEEKDKIKEESKVYRLHLTFAGAEGEDVQKVLGSEPAKRLLELVRYTLKEAILDAVFKPL